MTSQPIVRWIGGGVLVLGLVTFAVSCQKNQSQTPPSTAPAATDTTRSPALQRGQEAYLAYCAMCHGEAGGGDGPLATDLMKQGATKPAILNDRARTDELGHDGIVKVITQGGARTKRSNLMPAWGGRLDATLIGEIADFVMTLPNLTPGVATATIQKYLEAPAGAPDQGRKLFVFYCTGCHGPRGMGDGYLADTLWARNHIRPRNLTDSVYFATRTDQELYTTIALGGGHVGKSTYMPAWAVTLPPNQIKDLLSYVRVISRTAPRP